jgi:hypothetical protein
LPGERSLDLVFKCVVNVMIIHILGLDCDRSTGNSCTSFPKLFLTKLRQRTEISPIQARLFTPGAPCHCPLSASLSIEAVRTRPCSRVPRPGASRGVVHSLTFTLATLGAYDKLFGAAYHWHHPTIINVAVGPGRRDSLSRY